MIYICTMTKHQKSLADFTNVLFYFLFHVHPNHWKTLRLNHLSWPVRICRHMMQCHFFYWTKNGEEIKLVFYINVKLKSTFIKPVDCRLNCSLCWLLTRMGFKTGKICTLWRLKVEVFFPLQRTEEWQTNLTVVVICHYHAVPWLWQ